MNPVRSILIIRLSSIGDIILTTPVIRALHEAYPDAQIDYLTKKKFAPLITYHPQIREILTYDKNQPDHTLRVLKKEIHQREYDILVDIHNTFRSFYIKRGLKKSTVLTFTKGYWQRFLLLRFRIRNTPYCKTSIIDRYLNSLKNIIPNPAKKTPELYIPQHTEEAMVRALSQAKGNHQGPVIALVPGATAFTKKWPVEKFAETAKQLHHAKNAFIIILGGKNEQADGVRIQSAIGKHGEDYTGKTSLLETAALIKTADVIITNDTGALHMAQAYNKPIVAIFGSTSRELGYYPVTPNAVVLETPLPCRPCTHNGRDRCPKKHFKCMKDISVDSVISSTISILP